MPFRRPRRSPMIDRCEEQSWGRSNGSATGHDRDPRTRIGQAVIALPPGGDLCRRDDPLLDPHCRACPARGVAHLVAIAAARWKASSLGGQYPPRGMIGESHAAGTVGTLQACGGRRGSSPPQRAEATTALRFAHRGKTVASEAPYRKTDEVCARGAYRALASTPEAERY